MPILERIVPVFAFRFLSLGCQELMLLGSVPFGRAVLRSVCAQDFVSYWFIVSSDG
jgi:hypothetical protein